MEISKSTRSSLGSVQQIIVVTLLASLLMSGCVTTLGYVPEHLKPADTTTYIPTYTEVKKWAYDVVDGYDSRATKNRYAIYGAATIAAAAVSAIAGLAAFDSGSSALIGIPIGAGFLGSVATIYSSEEKAQIYGHARDYIKDLITASDRRTLTGSDLKKEAVCLRDDVNGVMRMVGAHITFLDPKNVGERLKAVQTQTGNNTVTLTLPPKDFSDINPTRPVTSSCDSNPDAPRTR